MKKLLSLMAIMSQVSFASNSQSILNQYGILDDAVHGQYSAIASVGQIAKTNNFGMGAGIGLGEVIAVNGKFYVTDAYGHLIRLDKKDQVSFMTATKFHPDQNLSFSIENISSLPQLEEQIEEELPNKDFIYAIKVTGYFDKLHARSEDVDQVPYTPIVEWMRTHQHEFDCNDQQSTLVMFRTPDNLSNIQVKYHTHFVNAKRTMGGHVFDVKASRELFVEIMPITQVQLYLRKDYAPVKSVNGNFQADKFYSVIEKSSASQTVHQ